jgi:hypothetical protein
LSSRPERSEAKGPAFCHPDRSAAKRRDLLFVIPTGAQRSGGTCFCLSSRPERSEAEGPAFCHTGKRFQKRHTSLVCCPKISLHIYRGHPEQVWPRIRPNSGEGSAVACCELCHEPPGHHTGETQRCPRSLPLHEPPH